MKKFLLLFAFVYIVVAGFSQSQRFVLLEEFTNASCGPCASQNPAFDALLTANAAKCTSIKFHTNWPGVDPMNAQNPADAAARVGYYGVTGVPYALMDGVPQTGTNYSGAPANVTQAKIDAEYSIPSPVEVSLQHYLSAGQDSVYSNILVKCTQSFTGTLVAHNVIIEKWIHFNSPPGSNGEKDFYNVMKKILPTSAGTSIPASMVPGDYVLIEGFWKFGTVYDKSQIASVGFVQDKNTKQVFQAGLSSTSALVMPYSNDLQVMSVSNVAAVTCKDKISPIVNVRNNGNTTVTTMTIKYKVNDGSLSTFTWNGSLASMKHVDIALPQYEFGIVSQNILTIYTVNPNNTADQYPKNDTLHYTIKAAPITTNLITLTLHTDNAPQETTWDVKNSLGVVVAHGGPYTQSNTFITENITLPQADCFTFNIYDSGGNGLCCANGNGAYQVACGSVVIKQGGTFGSSESSEFWMEAPASVGETGNATAFSVYPNPFGGSAKVSFYMVKAGDVTLSLYSALGQLVNTISLGNFDSGQHETNLDGQNLTPGMYILQLNTGSAIYSRKVSVIS